MASPAATYTSSLPRRVLPVGAQQQSFGTRPAASSYSTVTFNALKNCPPPAKWQWPAFWGLVAGFALQLFLGVFASLISFGLLIAANPHRCPVAVVDGAMKPFYAWFVGMVIGIVACEYCTTAPWSSNGSWVIWGGFTELWRVDRLLRHLYDEVV